MYCPQKGHCRSTNSTIVAGAFGLPSVAPLCGIPRNRSCAVPVPAIASPAPSPDFWLLPLWLTAISTPTTASAATVVAASVMSLRRRRSLAAAAASRATRSSRSFLFCSVRLAMFLPVLYSYRARLNTARRRSPPTSGTVPAVQLAGSSVLLTGASGGIGKAIARTLHARGARVILSGRNTGALEELRAELGGATLVLDADLADAAAVTALPERTGPLDVLVANAALPASGRVDSFTPEEIDRALDVNLRSPIQLSLALTPGMVERGRGHMVFIASLSGKISSGGSAIYSATKFGLRGFAAGLREDLLGSGVGVTTVYPGFISDAGMFAESGTKLPPGVGTRTPEAVAEAVVRGIEEGKAELDVAPLGMRLGARFWGLSPTAVGALQRRLGSLKVADSLAAGQRSKR